MVPPPGADDDAEMRARLTARIATVQRFLKILTEVIAFGAPPTARPVAGGDAVAAAAAGPARAKI